MQPFRIAILVLVLLMAVSLVNSAYLTRRCDEWTTRLNAVTDAAGNGDWDTARQTVDALDNDWQAKQSYLHITLQHEEINTADTLLQQCVLFVDIQDIDSLFDAALQLSLQWDHLAEMEQLSIKNVL